MVRHLEKREGGSGAVQELRSGGDLGLRLWAATGSVVLSPAAVTKLLDDRDALLDALETFALLATDDSGDLGDEQVITLTYDDPEWGECVLGERYMRVFRRARAAVDEVSRSEATTSEPATTSPPPKMNQNEATK